jgi:hypothetical protein
MWFGAELVRKRFDPFAVDKHFWGRAPVRGFHPRLIILFPFGEWGLAQCDSSATRSSAPLPKPGAGAERSSAIHANSIDARLLHENAERCSAQAGGCPHPRCMVIPWLDLEDAGGTPAYIRSVCAVRAAPMHRGATLALRCCPNFRCSAGFQPALSRQDGGATVKLGQHPRYASF